MTSPVGPEPRLETAAGGRVLRTRPPSGPLTAGALATLLLVALPVAFSGLLWLHPMLDDYEAVLDVYTRFQLVHVGMVLAVVVLAMGVYVLLEGLRGRAAALARRALIPFVAFYVPYVAFEGVGVGVLGQELNDLPAAQRDAITAELVEDFARNPILGEPGVFWALGTLAWIVVIIAMVLAFRQAGAPLVLQVLFSLSVLIGTHAPPLAPIGWLCFAAAALMVLRARGTRVPEPAPPEVVAAA